MRKKVGKLWLLFPLGFAMIMASTVIGDVTGRLGLGISALFAVGMLMCAVGGWYANKAIYGWYGQLFGMFIDRGRPTQGERGLEGYSILEKQESDLS